MEPGSNIICLSTPLRAVSGSIVMEPSGKSAGLSVLTYSVRKSWGSSSNGITNNSCSASSRPVISPPSESPVMVGRSLTSIIVRSKYIVSESEFSGSPSSAKTQTVAVPTAFGTGVSISTSSVSTLLALVFRLTISSFSDISAQIVISS